MFSQGYTLVIDHVRRQQVAAIEQSAGALRALPHRTAARPASVQVVAPEESAAQRRRAIVLRRSQSSALPPSNPPLNVRRVIVQRQVSPLRVGQRPPVPVSRVVAVSEELADSSSAQGAGTYFDAGGPPVEIEELLEYVDDDEFAGGAGAASAAAQMEPTALEEIPDEAADTISVLDPFGDDPPASSATGAATSRQSPVEASGPSLQTSRAQPDLSTSSHYSSRGYMSSILFLLRFITGFRIY